MNISITFHVDLCKHVCKIITVVFVVSVLMYMYTIDSEICTYLKIFVQIKHFVNRT